MLTKAYVVCHDRDTYGFHQDDHGIQTPTGARELMPEKQTLGQSRPLQHNCQTLNHHLQTWGDLYA